MIKQCITWKDAKSIDEWIEVKDIVLRLVTVVTYGVIVAENDTIVCVAQSSCQRNKQCCGLMFIPKACIVSRKDIKIC